ncbi:MAG: radical SAM protein [Desulfovibrio sp.]|nr:MAG: radical SAM protein [Desulfovibrio sp.]
MPRYLALHESGELAKRAQEAVNRLAECSLCPRECGVDRLQGETGHCLIGRFARVSSYAPHFGEEAPLVGNNGSGTLFFSGCNLLCVFCQNHDISHLPDGPERTPEQLARIMISLQESGCHNINFVTPTHVTAQILEALPHAVEMGLSLPLVYNCGGYESLETLALLDGIVDIFMPDIKFSASEPSQTYCRAKDYPERTRVALKEMFRQVGDLHLDDRGIAVSGLLVRHLVMPEDQAGTHDWMGFLAQEISPGTYVNIMDQYRPCGRAAASSQWPELNRAITPEEYQAALAAAKEAGITRLDNRGDRQALFLLKHLLDWDT